MKPTSRAKPPLPRARVRARSDFAPPPLPCDAGFAAKLLAEIDRFEAPRSELEARAQFAPAHPLPKPSPPRDLSQEQRVIVTHQPSDPPSPARQLVTLPPSDRAHRPEARWARSVALIVGASVLLGLATQAFAW